MPMIDPNQSIDQSDGQSLQNGITANGAGKALPTWRMSMFIVTKPSQNRVDLEFSGTLDADGMRAALNELLRKSEDVKDGKMFYRIGEFKLPTLGALAVELGMLPKLFSLLGKYDKCAVVSDSDWIRKATEIEGALIPGLEIRSFTPDEEEAAEVWLGL